MKLEEKKIWLISRLSGFLYKMPKDIVELADYLDKFTQEIVDFANPDRTAELEEFIKSENKGLKISEFLQKNIELEKEISGLKEYVNELETIKINYELTEMKIREENAELKEMVLDWIEEHLDGDFDDLEYTGFEAKDLVELRDKILSLSGEGE